MQRKLLHKIYLYILPILCFLISNINLHSQNYTPSEIKAAYIFNFVKLITWGNEDNLQEYKIGILDNDPSLYEQLSFNDKLQRIEGKDIKVLELKSIEDFNKCNLIYISKDFKKIDIANLHSIIQGKNILLVTENFDIENTMINFTQSNNFIRFELNTEYLEKENFEISSTLLSLSKSKNELKQLYLETEKLLESEKKLAEAQKLEIVNQKQKIEEQKLLLKNQLEKFDIQQKELEKRAKKLEDQNTLIASKENEIKKQNTRLVILNKNLRDQQFKLRDRIEIAEIQENKINEQTEKINTQLDVMSKLNKELDKKLEEISEQNIILTKQNVQIYNQRLVIILSFVFIGLIAILVVLTYKAYKSKIRINKELKQKNNAIIKQNSEIRQQKEEILSQKEEIDKHRSDLVINQKEIEKAYKKIEEKSNLLEIRNRYITDGIQYAQKIQESIFPTKTFINSIFPESFIFFLPKDILSGDFYFFDKTFSYDDDYSVKNEEIVFFSAVDCTGHGVPGALMSIVGYNLLNQAINEYKITSPSKILDFLNTGVQNTLKQTDEDDESVKDGMDLALCKYNLNTNILEYAGAFNPLYIYRDNELVEYKADVRPIGSNYRNKYIPFTNHQIELKKNDVIYLFSDGYFDQFGGANHSKFMRRKFKKLLQENHLKPMAEQKQILKEVFFEWKGDLEQYDDVLVMGIKIN